MSISLVIAVAFIAVAINHMGLVAAVEKVIRHPLPVVDCVKCLTFWSVLACLLSSRYAVIPSVAMTLAFSYMALWMELLWGLVDKLYMKCYEKIVSDSAAGEASAGSDASHPQDPVSYLR